MTKHIVLPWAFATVGTGGPNDNLVDVCEIRSSDGHAVVAEHVLEPDADFIVRAANNHYALVKALRSLTVLAEYNTTGPGKCNSDALTAAQATSLRRAISNIARDALRRAGAEP